MRSATVRLWPLAVVPLAIWALTHTGIEWGIDATSYWLPDPIGRYAIAAQGLEGSGAFRYAPPLALPVLAFGALPWEAFRLAWTVGLVVLLGRLVGWRWLPLALALPFVARSVVFGNIELPMAASLAVPVLWLVPIMAKVTPAVLLVWFVVRREWSTLARIAGVALAVSLLAEVVLPGSWAAWLGALRSEAGQDALYLPLRLAAAVALTVHAGLTGRRWLLPVALLLSLPHLGWSSLAVLAAMPRFLGEPAIAIAPERHPEPAPPLRLAHVKRR